MNYNITIETVEMDNIKISSPDGASRYYDMAHWTLGAAVENYVEDELMDI